jgi:hypothetical protein
MRRAGAESRLAAAGNSSRRIITQEKIRMKKLLIGAFALSRAGAFAPAASAATVTKVIVKHPHPHCRTVRTTVWRHHHKVVTVRKVCR